MTKKEIKAFFKNITDGDYSAVSDRINSDSEYLSVCNFAPPKKNDGQSGLQVAFKTGNFDIAKLLVEQGADVNFMETSDINEWTAPVLHDCIRAVIFSLFTVQNDTKKFDNAFPVLELMLEKKANPNATDSYGNNCLHRAVMDSRQLINNPGVDMSNGILLQQLRKVFKSLISAGADINLSNEKRPSAESIVKNYRLEQHHLW